MTGRQYTHRPQQKSNNLFVFVIPFAPIQGPPCARRSTDRLLVLLILPILLILIHFDVVRRPTSGHLLLEEPLCLVPHRLLRRHLRNAL